MGDNRPLIFIQPFSESLQKLRDAMNDVAESEGVEIYEVESLAEANQLLPTVGPSLSLCSSAKKCAMMLQANRKQIARLHSKVILLCKKPIPNKTMEKFLKMGLTDSIIEPVTPKTLLYKVKLLLRSLPTPGADQADENVLIAGGDETDNSNNEAQRIEKGVKLDKYLGRNNRSGKNASLELDEDDDITSEEMAESLAMADEAITAPKADLNLSPNMEASLATHNNKIDGHYRGSINTSTFDLAAEEEESNLDLANEEDDDLLKQAKEELNLEITNDADLYSFSTTDNAKKESSAEDPLQLNIEKENNSKKGKASTDHLNSHYKGDISEKEDDRGGILKGHAGSTKEKETHPDLFPTPKLSLSEEDDDTNELASLYEFKKKKKDPANAQLNITENEISNKKSSATPEASSTSHKKTTELELTEENDNTWQAKLKPTKEKEITEVAERPTISSPRPDHSLDLDDIYTPTPKKKGPPAPHSHAEKVSLNLETEDQERELANPIAELRRQKNKEKAALALAPSSDPLVTPDDPEGVSQIHSKKKAALNVAAASGWNDLQTSPKKNRPKGTSPFQIDKINLEMQDENGNTIKNHGVDHIQKYYGSKKKDEHSKGQDWDSLKKKEHVADWGKIKKTEERELRGQEKEDLGEQTINYKKLQEEFEVIKNYAPKRLQERGKGNTSSAQTKITIHETPALDRPQQDLFTAGEEEQIIESSDLTVYEPDSKGLEVVVQILNLYLAKNKTPYDLFKMIADEIKNEVNGISNFFMYNTKHKIFENTYSGTIDQGPHKNRDERAAIWSKTRQENLERWSNMALPTWSDSTFQMEHLEFFYPYFIGMDNMGFAVVLFEHGMDPTQCSKVEIILESARGVFLENFNTLHDEITSLRKQKAESSEKEDKGLWGKFFKKKTG